MILSKKIVFASLTLFVCTNIFAQINAENGNQTIVLHTIGSETPILLDEVKVKVAKNTPIVDGYVVNGEKIANTPTPTNSITDALRSNSNIQFSQNSRSSARGGEIAPPKVSIRGSMHYENNFMINGVSNNNNINPGGLENNAFSDFPSSEAQSLFLDTSLVDSISVYTEAISAEYGSFTGGVVDAKLKNAQMDRWHMMSNFRYTKDSWAKYHLSETQKNTAYATNERYQPEFNKYEYNVAFNGPVNDYLGLILSYGKTTLKNSSLVGIQYDKSRQFAIQRTPHSI
ncbi:MAG: Plug domain-containing protein [Campylobacteraceae bacterium]|nr:Plug domain-containing protein [Campylobacteraceae bacterium]